MLTSLPLSGAKVISSKKINDSRGWFLEAFKETWLEEHGIDHRLIFDCCSFNKYAGTLRGLHSQLGDSVPGKLLRVLSGSVQDVLVDARKGIVEIVKQAEVEKVVRRFSLYGED